MPKKKSTQSRGNNQDPQGKARLPLTLRSTVDSFGDDGTSAVVAVAAVVGSAITLFFLCVCVCVVAKTSESQLVSDFLNVTAVAALRFIFNSQETSGKGGGERERRQQQQQQRERGAEGKAQRISAMALTASAFPIESPPLSLEQPFCSQTMPNPKVFFDISIGGKAAGKIVMELRADVVPKTAGAGGFFAPVLTSFFQRTSVLCALARRALATRTAPSIVSSPDSWPRVATLPVRGTIVLRCCCCCLFLLTFYSVTRPRRHWWQVHLRQRVCR